MVSQVQSNINTKTLLVQQRIQNIQNELQKIRSLRSQPEKFKAVVRIGKQKQNGRQQAKRIPSNKVIGCTSQVWTETILDPEGNLQFSVDSDSAVSLGLAQLLADSFSGLPATSLQKVNKSMLRNILTDHPLDPSLSGNGNTSAAGNSEASSGSSALGQQIEPVGPKMDVIQVFNKMLSQAQQVVYDYDPFPSLIINKDTVVPQGSYSHNQATFLNPPKQTIDTLVKSVKDQSIGIVAHYYMDPTVQGVLQAVRAQWPHVHISDSLAMADAAKKMVEGGCKHILVMGVDFMSENVKAVLEHSGYPGIKVYKMSTQLIGCTLAEAAESEEYYKYLKGAQDKGDKALHVIYINTSLETKGLSQQYVPTITCTSSNVVQTVLQASHQVDDLKVYFGPDTFMGGNLRALLTVYSKLDNKEIKQIHSGHNQETIKRTLDNLEFFQHGKCVVHEQFQADVLYKLRNYYQHAYITAHFEVPGEMFDLALVASRRDRGTVGSTSDILKFIKHKVSQAIEQGPPAPGDESNAHTHGRLSIVLGTESSMVAAIVADVQQILSKADANGEYVPQVEIVFPAAQESVTQVGGEAGPVQGVLGGLTIVPGASTGEGCSPGGGCAACPYMQMNSLDALLSVCGEIERGEGAGFQIGSQRDVGSGGGVEQSYVPILNMREFQQNGELSESLVQDISARSKS